MDKFARLENIAELEPLDEAPREASPKEPRADSTLLNLSCIKNIISSYSVLPQPVALLDSSLNFLYKNDAFNTVIRSFEYPQRNSFLSTFSRCLSDEETTALIKSLKDKSKGYYWKGSLNHHAKYAGSMLTKAHIMPFKPDDIPGHEPIAWVVMMDDVTDEHKSFLRGTYSGLLQASKLKDRDTGHHIERVNRYCHVMAAAMYGDERWPDVDVDFVESIGFLAAMHDVGKIGTPDDILNKNGPLNEFEWAIMKEHTINGAFILSGYPNPMAKQIAQSHHEWWNGTGYPYRLMGDMIPLPARIVALADVYDALRMKRSYKAPFDHKRAALLITADKTTHFDPQIVSVFMELQADFERIFEENSDEA